MQTLNHLNKNMFSEKYNENSFVFDSKVNGDFVLLPDGKCIWMLDGIKNGFPPC